MIKPTELRIGNKIRQSHATLRVLEVKPNKVLCTDDNGHINYVTPEYIDGLDLTEEWLLKMGFDMSGAWKKLTIKDGEGQRLELSCSRNWFALKSYNEQGMAQSEFFEILMHQKEQDPDYDIDKAHYIRKEETIILGKIEFVHQLQNLYHSLIGQELSLTSEINSDKK